MQRERERPFSSIFNGWASMQLSRPLTSPQGFFIETADQNSFIASWEMVHRRLKQRIGVILYREHSKTQVCNPLLGGWASIWRPQKHIRIAIHMEQGSTTAPEVIWDTFHRYIAWRWQSERRELILRSRKRPLDFDHRVLKFLNMFGFR